jgi:hypothetical protein
MLTTHPLLVSEWIMGRAIPLPPSVRAWRVTRQCCRNWAGGSRYKLPGAGSPDGDPGPQYVKCILIFSRCALAGLG